MAVGKTGQKAKQGRREEISTSPDEAQGMERVWTKRGPSHNELGPSERF